MARTARRSVAIDPSFLSTSLPHQHHQQSQQTQQHEQQHHTSSAPGPQQSAAQSTIFTHKTRTSSSGGQYQFYTPVEVSTSGNTVDTDSQQQPHSAVPAVDPVNERLPVGGPTTTSQRSAAKSTVTRRSTAAAPSSGATAAALQSNRNAHTANGIGIGTTVDHSTHHHHHNGTARQFGPTTHATHRPLVSPPPSSSPTSSPLPPTFNTSRIYDRVAAERERVRADFFATYDVMTGVRIAATLGGFFGLMVFLVVYKSRGESQETIKALKDPKIAAATAAVMQEEEERELQEAMEATGMSIYPDEYEHLGYGRDRMMSVGNISAPPVFNRGYRLSSIGGVGSIGGGSGAYSSLLSPMQRRFSYSESGRNSVSASSRVLSNYPMGASFGIDDYFAESDGDEADDEFDNQMLAARRNDSQYHRSGSKDASDLGASLLLSVPGGAGESRRSSNITCCSTDSSYLERRCSDATLGLTSLSSMATPRLPRRPCADTQPHQLCPPADFDAFPGIQVIQPTPRQSPSNSGRNSRERYFAPSTDSSTLSKSTTKPTPPPPPSTPRQPTHVQLRSKSLSLEHQPQSLDTQSAPYTSTSSIASYPTCPNAHTDGPHSSPAPAIPMTTRTHATADRSGLAASNDRTATATTTFSCSPRLQRRVNSHGSQSALRRAPLASISSFKISSIDYQDSDLKSLGSDSVFAESYYADTDDEMEPFSTDSDGQTTTTTTTTSEERLPRPHNDATTHRSPLARPRTASVRKTASSSTIRQQSLPSSTTTPSTCTTINETHKTASSTAASAPTRNRRTLLQRSSTIFPSSESLPKTTRTTTTTPQPNIETMVTIESAPQASDNASVSPASAVDAMLVQSTPPSTRSLPASIRPTPTSHPVSFRTPPPFASDTAYRRHRPHEGINQRSSGPSCLTRDDAGANVHTRPGSGSENVVTLELPTISLHTSANEDALRNVCSSVCVVVGTPSAPSTTSPQTATPRRQQQQHNHQPDPSLPPDATDSNWSKETLF